MARTGGLGRGGCGGWESRRRVGARREASPRRPLQARPPRGPSCCTSFGSPAPSFCVGAAGCSFLRTGLYWGGGSWLLLPESASSGFRESPVGSGFCWERRPEGRRRAGGRAVGEGPALQGDQRTGTGAGAQEFGPHWVPWVRKSNGDGKETRGWEALVAAVSGVTRSGIQSTGPGWSPLRPRLQKRSKAGETFSSESDPKSTRAHGAPALHPRRRLPARRWLPHGPGPSNVSAPRASGPLHLLLLPPRMLLPWPARPPAWLHSGLL